MRQLAALAAALLTALALAAVCAAEEPMINTQHIYVAAPGGIPCEASHTNGRLADTIEPGSTVYFVIDEAVRAEDLADRYARILFSDKDSGGEEYVGEPTIEYRMLYDAAGTRQIGYSYVIALPVLSVRDTEMHPVRGRAALSRLQTGSFSFSFYVQENSGVADAQPILCGDADLPLRFADEASYVQLQFSGGVQFTVDVSGQEPVNVGVSFETFTDLAWAYPLASLRCISWTHTPVFNRTGTLTILEEPDFYLYEIRGKELFDLTDTYFEERGAFVISTRRLGSFVISDRPLGKAENTDLPQNPPTGAFDA